MTVTYDLTIGDTVLRGDATDVLDQWRRLAQVPVRDVAAFKHVVAKRVWVWDGTVTDPEADDDAFLQQAAWSDLIQLLIIDQEGT